MIGRRSLGTPGLFLILTLVFGPSAHADETATSPEKSNLYLGGDFDQWDWVPISYYALPGMKAAKKAGFDLNCEVRGPLYRVPLGLDTVGPCGYMVEGAEAYKGKAVRFLANDPNNEFTMAQYCNGLRTDRRVRYEVAVKGKGKVFMRIWVSGWSKVTNQFAWVGFPNLFSLEATDKWILHSGSFDFPAPPDPNLTMDKTVYTRLCVQSGGSLMVDELKVWQE